MGAPHQSWPIKDMPLILSRFWSIFKKKHKLTMKLPGKLLEKMLLLKSARREIIIKGSHC